jgi:hypothetical protein
VKFRIYYGDGSTFEGRPEDAPVQNVQFISWDDPTRGINATGRFVLEAWDLYIYSDNVEGWIGTNKYADLVRHVQDGGVRAVLEGKWIKRETFVELREKAYNDPPFNRKSLGSSFEDGEE